MTTMQAIQIIEDDSGSATFDDVVDAYQSLVDSGVVWQLQGFYGRTATRLIDHGHVTRKES